MREIKRKREKDRKKDIWRETKGKRVKEREKEKYQERKKRDIHIYKKIERGREGIKTGCVRDRERKTILSVK